ncbi:MAG: FHA domain-containing protein [Gemmataceae bacterium]|nr:FHA domain-containing protein [Gemmataceae bacterium]MCI0741990.1 FHA domain-containing protein [Gemmataceae bacterium]
MIKCPFCGFDNEDGALFCEQCKSDLSAVPATPPPAELPPAEVPVAAVVEEAPVAALVQEAEPVAAAVVEETMAAAPAPTEAAAAPAAEAPAGQSVPPGSQVKLVVIRGQKINMEFPVYGELNFIGRADEKPVDIDLEDQEPPDRVWTSRQHAVIEYNESQGIITIEDLNSSNGTYVNRNRVHPGQKRQLFVNDVVQIGTVHMKLKTS